MRAARVLDRGFRTLYERCSSERIVALALIAAFGLASGASAKEHSRFVTAEMRANALVNARRFEWAAAQQKEAVGRAQPWLEKEDDALWEMAPSQNLPRGMYLWDKSE